MNHHFEKPKLLNIATYFLNNNCDMDLQLQYRLRPDANIINRNQPDLPQVLKRSIRVFITELIP